MQLVDDVLTRLFAGLLIVGHHCSIDAAFGTYVHRHDDYPRAFACLTEEATALLFAAPSTIMSTPEETKSFIWLA